MKRKPGVHVPTLRERFDAKWKIDPITGCWMWTAYKDGCGYGRILVDRKCRMAHRVAYSLYVGKLDADCVMHRCVNKSCVNPDHLIPGSSQDKSNKMVADDVQAKGHIIHKKLTEADVVRMRKRYSLGVRTRQLSDDFGITAPCVIRIVSGDAWGHVEGAVAVRQDTANGENSSNAIATEQRVMAMRECYVSGDSIASIARAFTMNEDAVRAIVKGRNWKHVPMPTIPSERLDGRMKLSAFDRAAIRDAYARGESSHDIAARYGVTNDHVTRVARTTHPKSK